MPGSPPRRPRTRARPSSLFPDLRVIFSGYRLTGRGSTRYGEGLRFSYNTCPLEKGGGRPDPRVKSGRHGSAPGTAARRSRAIRSPQGSIERNGPGIRRLSAPPQRMANNCKGCCG
ncbi:hypothetical protein [Burkholderia thailandensis]|uniref:hypothetical protein n=1 Tax=Burkholderia thailandensis TaxID=57975 RepID=UPI0009B5A63A|nr:hypothetical protein [Burkholderia thailandensis]AVR09308.1 hypothetical protein A8H31_17875 [Burkholderia thailandensis]AWY57962.1 hypothetical protein A8H35_05395 [Burkholderia thailandensis]AWY67864.1 hypothetical protein A8H36_22930 [Burkholderia thailandensis]NOK42322.1 hypothetical protein [Burkholderia thailandensis]NOK54704.1 hypothetical protein [Burkholderia thailandensis]